MLLPMYADMLHLAHKWQGMTLFYNGALCGASAPDHAHLQAVPLDRVPLFGEYWREEVADGLEPLLVNADGGIYNVTTYTVPLFRIESRNVSRSVELLKALLAAMPVVGDEPEPRMNVFVYNAPGEGYVTTVIPRAAHRPACYGADGGGQRLVSPGALDMAGLMITPRSEDFRAISADEASAMLQEVALSPDAVESVIDELIGGE
jgi:hypothetical protein